MKPTITAKLSRLADRLDEVNTLLSSETATADMDAYRKLHRERAELEPVVTLYHSFQSAEADVATALEMAEDPEMRDFAADEVPSHFQSTPLGAGLRFQLAWPAEPPKNRQVQLFVLYPPVQ